MSLPALIVIRGDEPLLVDRGIARAAAAAIRVDPETERREASARGLTVGEFNDLVAPSLFAEPRVVVLREAHEALKDLAVAVDGYIADPAEGVTLVVHHSGGARNKPLVDHLIRAGAAVVECAKITRTADRVAFVRAEISEAGGRATPDAVAALIDAVGNDLAELASAAAQLVSDTPGPIDLAAVHRYHSGRAGVSGFTVADLAVEGRIGPALEALRWALTAGEPAVRLSDALATGVVSLAKVAGSAGGSAGQLASRLGMPPWKIDKLRGLARTWSARGLETALAVVTRLNADVKGGAADVDYALERAVIEIGRAKRLAH